MSEAEFKATMDFLLEANLLPSVEYQRWKANNAPPLTSTCYNECDDECCEEEEDDCIVDVYDDSEDIEKAVPEIVSTIKLENSKSLEFMSNHEMVSIHEGLAHSTAEILNIPFSMAFFLLVEYQWKKDKLLEQLTIFMRHHLYILMKCLQK
jgi:hypothetical protein